MAEALSAPLVVAKYEAHLQREEEEKITKSSGRNSCARTYKHVRVITQLECAIDSVARRWCMRNLRR